MERANYTYSAGGVVVNKMTGDVLIVKQPNNVWSLPKGHIESDEDSVVAAKREIFEESGVTEPEFIKELGEYERFKIGKDSKNDESELKNIKMYLFTTNQKDLQPIDKKHPEARWVKQTEVAKFLTHEKDQEFFENILSELPPILTKNDKK